MNPVSLEMFQASEPFKTLRYQCCKSDDWKQERWWLCHGRGGGQRSKFGVEVNDVERDLASRGHIVHMFDHPVEGPPHIHENFRFNKIGVCPSDEDTSELR